MKHLFTTLIFIIFASYALAQDDPRSVIFSPGSVPDDNPNAKDTSKSIVIYGANDMKGMYSVNGVNLPLTFTELNNLLVTFYRDFPKDAKSDTEGFLGISIPKPNLLYRSLSWAELKNNGRNLMTKTAKNNNVSIHYFSINPSYSVTKKVGLSAKTPDLSGAFIDYYDKRLALTAAALWPKKHGSQKATKDFSKELNQIWKDEKITPDQPFKAKVVAAGGMSPWSGYTVIYLQESGGEKRFLEAKVAFGYSTGVTYKILPHKSFKQISERLTKHPTQNSTLLTDPIDVTRLVWFSPLGYIGSVFEEQDIVRSSYLRFLKNR